MFEQIKIKIIKDFLKNNANKMLKGSTGVFKHPFIDPGAGYKDNLWDWDSFWSANALMGMYEYLKNDSDFSYEENKRNLSGHLKGNVLNFLDFMHNDGFLPMMVTATGLFSTFLSEQHIKGNRVNQHKPFLCAQALNAACFDNDYDFLKDIFNSLKKYLSFYDNNQCHDKSGLYFWQNDIIIGIDNNPTVFGRQGRSSADIYLNCFLYQEFRSIAAIADILNQKEDYIYYTEKAIKLKTSINAECWDNRDGFYYSVDINVKTNSDEVFHHGIGAFWNTIPLKIRIWAGFLPMFCGIASKEQAARIVSGHYHDEAFNSLYGIRTLARDEKMYNTTNSSNPSNWLGAVWIVANYCVFRGLMNYGYLEEAMEIADKTLELLAMDIKENNCMSESYIPETGEPMMHKGFLNWNVLIASMLKELDIYE